MPQSIDNLHVSNIQTLPSPAELKSRMPVPEGSVETIREAREQIRNIIAHRDSRFLVIVGPCTIHDTKAAIEYAKRLKDLQSELDDTLCIVMRTCFEQPRTTTGWAGLINDPYLDDSFRIEDGLTIVRDFLLYLNELGLPCATETPDPISVQFFSDLISWYAVGARIVLSPTHREMPSGLSAPVGFKTSPDGDFSGAFDGMHTVAHQHRFLGVDTDGTISIISTTGNPYSHLVLRGAKQSTELPAIISNTTAALSAASLGTNMVIDCSQSTEENAATHQAEMLKSTVELRCAGDRGIIGLTLKSNLVAGKQDISNNLSELQYGQSITNHCIDWETTEKCLISAAQQLREQQS